MQKDRLNRSSASGLSSAAPTIAQQPLTLSMKAPVHSVQDMQAPGSNISQVPNIPIATPHSTAWDTFFAVDDAELPPFAAVLSQENADVAFHGPQGAYFKLLSDLINAKHPQVRIRFADTLKTKFPYVVYIDLARPSNYETFVLEPTLDFELCAYTRSC